MSKATSIFALVLLMALAFGSTQIDAAEGEVAVELPTVEGSDQIVDSPTPDHEGESGQEVDLFKLFGGDMIPQSGQCGGNCSCGGMICVGDESCCDEWFEGCRGLRDIFCDSIS